VYGSGPGEPSIIPESHISHRVELAGYGKDCAEAETYARDFGRRRRDVDVVILRTQSLAGPTLRTNMMDYLSLSVVPTGFGYDPRLQLLHEEDAVEVLRRATIQDCRGIFNVAADGVVFLSKAIRMLGRVQLPVLSPAVQPVAVMLRRLGLVDFPLDQLKLIAFGRVLDTRRIKAALGWSPRYTTESTLKDFRDHRERDYRIELRPRPAWEAELLVYLNRRKNREEERV
jgi:UDP-glucose 4-epimerase